MRPPDLPPISNKPLYAYRVFAKWLSFFVFGLGSLILVILFFPPMRLFIHPRDRFKKYARHFVSSSLNGFVFFMRIIRMLKLEVDNRETLQQLSSKIIVANHPSLLDAIILLSLFPNADTIVSPRHSKNFFLRGVIRQLYIPGFLDYEDILSACAETLQQGNCLIIFPEGTRTPRMGKVIVKKGAARIALASGCNIVPVHIGGTDKYGLGKKDPWTGFNPRERYIYTISMGTEISPKKYQDFSLPKAARALTREIEASLFPVQEK